MWWLVSVASAGVWVRDAGQAWVQVAVVHQESDSVHLATGEVVPQSDEALLGALAPLLEEGRYAATDLAAYAEVGLGRGFEGMVSAPLRYAQNRWALSRGAYPDIVQQNVGLGDLTAGLRYGGTSGGLAYSAYATGRLPLYDNRPVALQMHAGNSDFEDDRVPLGQGTIDAELGGAVGYGGRWAWGLAEAGVRARTQQFSAVVPARIQGGVKPVDRVAAWAGASLQASLGNGRAPDFFRDRWGKGPIAIDNQSALTVDAGLGVDLVEGFGLTAGASRVVWALRFPSLTSVSAGLTWTGSLRR